MGFEKTYRKARFPCPRQSRTRVIRLLDTLPGTSARRFARFGCSQGSYRHRSIRFGRSFSYVGYPSLYSVRYSASKSCRAWNTGKNSENENRWLHDARSCGSFLPSSCRNRLTLNFTPSLRPHFVIPDKSVCGASLLASCHVELHICFHCQLDMHALYAHDSLKIFISSILPVWQVN